jgi:hypothetical protein
MAVVHGGTLFHFLPSAFTAVMLPLALLGWIGTRGATATRVTMTLGAWLAAFFVIGRPDNFYWGLLLAPILPLGAVLALPALRDLLRAAVSDSAERVNVRDDRGTYRLTLKRTVAPSEASTGSFL